jgi:hypothetical protein
MPLRWLILWQSTRRLGKILSPTGKEKIHAKPFEELCIPHEFLSSYYNNKWGMQNRDREMQKKTAGILKIYLIR